MHGTDLIDACALPGDRHACVAECHLTELAHSRGLACVRSAHVIDGQVDQPATCPQLQAPQVLTIAFCSQVGCLREAGKLWRLYD
jgi:hypothetical protein